MSDPSRGVAVASGAVIKSVVDVAPLAAMDVDGVDAESSPHPTRADTMTTVHTATTTVLLILMLQSCPQGAAAA